MPASWRQLEHSASRGSLHRWLQPPVLIPDVEGAAAARCCLTMRPQGQAFKSTQLNVFLASLFHAVSDLSLHTSCSKVAWQLCVLAYQALDADASSHTQVLLSRWDLHHAHCFRTSSGGLGLLFHSVNFLPVSCA